MDESVVDYSPNNIETNNSSILALDIIIHLNGIKDEKYSAKIAYETFRTIGRIYERRYQKDVNNSMDSISPILKIMDGVFLEISKNVKVMNKSVKKGFFHAYKEIKSLEFLEELEGHELDDGIKWLNELPNPDDSPLDYTLNEMDKIRKSEWIKYQDSTERDLTACAIIKYKLMKQLDWLYCSMDKEILIDFNKITETTIETETLPKILNTNETYMKNPSLKSIVKKKFNNFSNDNRWKNEQELTIILKSNSGKKDTPYIDSKKIPDASNLEKIEQILEYLQKDKKLSLKHLSNRMGITPRMASYYLEAAEMLKIVKRTGAYYFRTSMAENYHRYSKEDKKGIIEQAIREMPITKSFMLYLKNASKTNFTHKDVTRFLEKSTELSYTTCFRRASTLTTWFCDGGITNMHNGRYSIKHNDGQTTILEFFSS